VSLHEAAQRVLGMNEDSVSSGSRLNGMLSQAKLTPLNPALSSQFESYLTLLLRWNARTNLTAVRDEEGILSRHFVESIACAEAIPAGIKTLLDFGSGAGFPGIPIALCHPEIAITLAESQGKKAAFLHEAIRALGLPAKVHSGRAENLRAEFDCVTLRAVDRMSQAVDAAVRLIAPEGWLIVMTSGAELAGLQGAAGTHFVWKMESRLPGSDDRLIAMGQKQFSSPV